MEVINRIPRGNMETKLCPRGLGLRGSTGKDLLACLMHIIHKVCIIGVEGIYILYVPLGDNLNGEG